MTTVARIPLRALTLDAMLVSGAPAVAKQRVCLIIDF
jgi:hypothetical protein